MEVDAHVVSALRRAVRDCTDRGLYFASKWASELLLAIPTSKRSSQDSAGHSNLRESYLEDQDSDALLAARAFADAKEFSRAALVLKECKGAKAQFVRVYNEFLAAEKKALRDWHNLDFRPIEITNETDKNPHQPATPINHSLLEILSSLQNATDPWLLFMKALLLKRTSRRDEAIEALMLSISAYPWNWSAWRLLGSCVGDSDELASLLTLISLPPTHPLVHCFQIKTLNDLQQPQENELALCDNLLGPDMFPHSTWIMSLRACVLYHLHDFSKAEAQFDQIVALDPYRMDDIDIFSDILYVAENRTKLSKLAHHFLAIDKDRPEVCCLVGNHYSLRADQEKAIAYFRRATELDMSYLPAWTLMGHEYVEMKNSHAAIEAYRRAIDVNRKDYRAWYGLGQAYELLNMHQYSLHYYQRATALRPYDVRVWQAQGMCYEEMGSRPREAIECYKRALIGADPRETPINLKLAKLHDDVEEYAEAASYHQRVVEVSRAEGKQVHVYSRSCIYVAQFHMEKGGKDLTLAKEYLERVATSNAEEVTQAAELLKRLKSISEGRGIPSPREPPTQARSEGNEPIVVEG
ncbi:TPR-like protein [Rickenella mellea]|uniref:TPR-like protein n=1 Tax=Rickenella mellea TaxID=50990 RepID=A0A4Y7PRS8_9AGAM|nr:TPR-like protein [Rickenella mellea]